jgi:Polyketide cyclase / dehydrase and lipid transport
MKISLWSVAVVALLSPLVASAHGPSRQKVDETVQINAPADKVWAMVSDYCSVSKWNPEVTACSAEPGNKPDTVRTITLKSGEQIQEQLAKYEPEAMKMQFFMVQANPKAMPINTLGSIFTVAADPNGGSVVEWKAAFYRSFPGPTPPPELSDEAATKAVQHLIRAGLDHLKELAEK